MSDLSLETSSKVSAYDLEDLIEWDRRIREKVDEFGLDCFPQEFEICDHNQIGVVILRELQGFHYPRKERVHLKMTCYTRHRNRADSFNYMDWVYILGYYGIVRGIHRPPL